MPILAHLPWHAVAKKGQADGMATHTKSQMTPHLRKRSSSSAEIPSMPPYTSSLCWPKSGAGRIGTDEADIFNGNPGIRIGPRTG